ncbi:FBD-associated F-box protein At4g13985-like [Rosa rugosa]|uniref:FBD-associated F-box protein At4g13985-like n=1 Tax=Rosa rugosa TaxID=74645 RepID=UPI002B408D64|nr:FBD-associated F-box protein At4g13985-like [Rosa rugosa]
MEEKRLQEAARVLAIYLRNLLDTFWSSDDNRSSFLKAVDRALILRDADIEQFSLSFPVKKGDASRVSSWTSGLVWRNVEKLSLALDGARSKFFLPPCLFTCATLRDLELYVPTKLKVPATVSFPSLRRLSLNSLVFTDDYSTQKLFSGCPVLNELSLINCNWANLKSVTISASNLLSLIIYETGGQLQLFGRCCEIMVYGVSLKYFRYKGGFLNDYYFDNSYVDKAEILTPTLRLRHVSYRLYKLFREFSSMKMLTTSSSSFKVVQTYNASELLAQIPLFSNLATLIFEENPVNIYCEGLLRMFQNCPSLQTLVFSEGVRLWCLDAEEDGVLRPQPPCFLETLEKIEVHAFHGNRDELAALKVLLKNAMVLEKLIITCSDSFEGGPEKLKDVNNQLADLPRGSSKCCEFICSLRP